MDRLAIQLALHGMAVIIVSIVAGLILWRVLRHARDGADWHLVHASGSVRGVFLLALAPVIRLAAVPEWLAVAAAWQIIFFAWTSLLAMLLRALSGEPGFDAGGSMVNRIVFVLYLIGAIALIPACASLAIGLLRAL